MQFWKLCIYTDHKSNLGQVNYRRLIFAGVTEFIVGVSSG